MSEYIFREVHYGYTDGTALGCTLEKQEEIVRCRDCYFADEIEGGYWCDRFDCGKEHVTPNGFCAWGERRTNDQMETQD